MNISSNRYSLSKVAATAAMACSAYGLTNTPLETINTISTYVVRNTTAAIKNSSKTMAYISIKARNYTVTDLFPMPKTELGRKLLAHRKLALARGIKLLTADDINLIVAEGRGLSV